MIDKLYCPFCGEEMKEETFYVNRKFYWCTNPKCDNDWGAGCSRQIVQALIDGKKAQEDLKCAKEELECAKYNYSVLSEQKEIAYQNYLKITGDLQAKLDATQEKLTKALGGLYCGHCVKTAEASQRWSEAIFFAKNFIGHGINSNTANYSESNCRWALNEIDKILSGKASITKQEE